MSGFDERTIIPSIAVASQAELASLSEMTLREREWYAGIVPFNDYSEVLAATNNGELKYVAPDENFELVGRMQNPNLFAAFPPVIAPHAKRALQLYTALWRTELEFIGIHKPDLRLAVSSLTRTTLKQNDLVNDPTKLASPDSTHTKGHAFDIDASAYYVYEDGVLKSVMHPNRSKEAVTAVGRAIQNDIVEADRYQTPISTQDYDPRFTEVMLNVADRLHGLGLINRIIEYADTNQSNRCLHIAPHPTEFPSST